MDDKRLNDDVEERGMVESYDATLDDDVAEERTESPMEGMTEDELQESLLEDSSLNGFQKKCARIRDDVWNKLQIGVGIVMGMGVSLALFWNSITGTPENEGSMFSIPLVIALVIALAGPNIIEKQTARKIPKGRITMAITLGVLIVVYFLVTGISSGFRFK